MMDAQYKIIGGDGAEYGPVSLEELQTWISDGRVSGATQVWRSDMSLWSTADRYQELQQALSRLYAKAPATVQSLGRPAGFWARAAAYLLDQLVQNPPEKKDAVLKTIKEKAQTVVTELLNG